MLYTGGRLLWTARPQKIDSGQFAVFGNDVLDEFFAVVLGAHGDAAASHDYEVGF